MPGTGASQDGFVSLLILPPWTELSGWEGSSSVTFISPTAMPQPGENTPPPPPPALLLAMQTHGSPGSIFHAAFTPVCPSPISFSLQRKGPPGPPLQISSQPPTCSGACSYSPPVHNSTLALVKPRQLPPCPTLQPIQVLLGTITAPGASSLLRRRWKRTDNHKKRLRGCRAGGIWERLLRWRLPACMLCNVIL